MITTEVWACIHHFFFLGNFERIPPGIISNILQKYFLGISAEIFQEFSQEIFLAIITGIPSMMSSIDSIAGVFLRRLGNSFRYSRSDIIDSLGFCF